MNRIDIKPFDEARNALDQTFGTKMEHLKVRSLASQRLTIPFNDESQECVDWSALGLNHESRMISKYLLNLAQLDKLYLFALARI